jgi:hypothetical protein
MQMSIAFDDNKITISQQRTIEELAIEYHLENCKPNTLTPMASNLDLVHFDEFDPNLPYRNLLGSLLWLARGTRPDISFAVGYLSQFCHSYGEEHFNAARRVLKYLIATKDRTLVLPKINHKVLTITAYSDSDWAGDKDDRHSMTGTVILLNGAPIVWSARKQGIVTTSSTEAEYVALSETTKDVLYVNNLLNEFTTVAKPTYIFVDNSGAIAIASKNINNQRTKHIDVRYHHVRDWVQSKVVQVEKIGTIDNLADLFTKPLPTQLHQHHALTLVR